MAHTFTTLRWRRAGSAGMTLPNVNYRFTSKSSYVRGASERLEKRIRRNFRIQLYMRKLRLFENDNKNYARDKMRCIYGSYNISHNNFFRLWLICDAWWTWAKVTHFFLLLDRFTETELENVLVEFLSVAHLMQLFDIEN
jgi:AcrR family transcriptional regulator